MKYCKQFRHQFVMPEHLLLALFEQVQFTSALFSCNCNVTEFHRKLVTYLVSMEQMPGKADYEPEGSTQFGQMMDMAYQHVEFSSAPRLDVTHIIASIFQLPDSMARFLLAKVLGDKINEFMGELISQYEGDAPEEYEEEDDEATYSEPWRNLVVCLNDTVDKHNPLIGREKELERTIQVLCRKEKNNPLHVGEPGVGKTAIVYGLAARIVKGDCPNGFATARFIRWRWVRCLPEPNTGATSRNASNR